MTPLKCVLIPVFVAAIGVLWFLYRKKVSQILIVIAAAILIGGVIRLFNMRDDAGTVETVILAMGALAVVWLGTWLGTRLMRPRDDLGQQGGRGQDK